MSSCNQDTRHAPNRGRRRTRKYRVATSLIVLACIAWLVPSAALAGPFKRSPKVADGQTIEIKGRVTDLTGDPIEGVRIELRAARRAFSFHYRQRALFNPVEVFVRTDETGHYTIPWKWHKYYNDFLVRAVVQVPQGGANDDKKEVLAQVDLTDELPQTGPVVASMTIENTDFLRTFRSFVATIDSGDEKRVYQEQGTPDKVDTVDRPERTDETWWYFARGTAYRFEGGRLIEVDSFDPVRGFDESAGD